MSDNPSSSQHKSVSEKIAEIENSHPSSNSGDKRPPTPPERQTTSNEYFRSTPEQPNMPGPFAVTPATRMDPSVIYPMKPSLESADESSQGPSSSNREVQGETVMGRKSTLGRALDMAKSKLNRRPSNAETLPGNERDFERSKAKEVKKEKRKEEYERLGLGEKTKMGTPGAGGWSA